MTARIGVLAALAACLAVGVPGGHADTVDGLRGTAAGLASAEREALLRLYAAETATARARDEAAALERQVARLDAQVAAGKRYTAIARRARAVSQQRVAELLRSLYVEGPPPDAFALILGADSFDAAIDAVDSLRLAVDQNRRLAEQATTRSAALRAATARLRAQAADLRASRDRAAAAVRQLELVTSDRTRTLASLRRQRVLTEQRLARVQADAQAAAAKAAEIQAAADRARATAAAAAPAAPSTSDPAPEPAADSAPAQAADPDPAPATPLPSGATAQLVVESTAYSLSGTTASGIPVGPGIIAVDPSVIPLGTRVYVPGYGTAVAADTGSAVQGRIIDVWLPTREAALAWGRRAITITIYRS